MKAREIVLLVVAVLGLAASACASTGAYPRDFFIEMHYQRSFQSQEPPRLYPPPLAVPVSGREVPPGTFQEARELKDPLPSDPETLGKSGSLFLTDCAMCHGLAGRGDSFVAGEFQRSGIAPPADLGSQRVKDRPPGQVYWILTNGFGGMPPFGKLLTSEERWTLVRFVRFFAENSSALK